MPSVIKIGFNPDEIEDEELQKLFDNRSVGIKFWMLYKQGHIVDQHFTPGCLLIDEHYAEVKTIDDFVRLVRNAMRQSCGMWDLSSFIAKHWDHFNPNIRRKLTIEWGDPPRMCL